MVSNIDTTEVIQDVIEFLNTTRSSKHLAVLLDLLELFKARNPSLFQYYFARIIDILVGWCIDPGLPKPILEKLLNALTDYWPFWMANIDHGIDLISNLCYDLEQDYGICVEPGKPENTVASRKTVEDLTLLILQTCTAVTKGLIMAAFPTINSQTSYSIASNLPLQQRFRIAVKWLIKIASTLGLQLLSQDLNKVVFATIGVVFQTCTSGDDLAMLGLDIVEKYRNQITGFELADVDNWIDNLSSLFSCSGIHLIKPPNEIIELFLKAEKNNFIFKDYLPRILDKPLYLERLQFACVTMASFQHPDIPDSIFKSIDDAFQWFLYLGATTSKKPKVLPILETASLTKYKKLLTFLMDLVTNLSCISIFTVYPGAMVFRKFYKILTSSSTTNFTSLQWWNDFEYSILCNLKRIAKFNKFFLPRLMIQQSDISDENFDIIQYQFKIISLLARPNHYGQNILGFKWIEEIILHLSDKNVLNTDVADSLVLHMVEETLTQIIYDTGDEEDCRIRENIGRLWSSYLQYFSANRRGLPKSAKIISLILRQTFDVDLKARQEFFKALCNIDAFDSLLALDKINDCFAAQFKNSVIRSKSLGTFNSNNSLVVSSYLGITKFIQNSGLNSPIDVGLNVDLAMWLPNLYLSCKADRILGATKAGNNACNFLDLMLYSVLWEMARYFINSRLKTSFGSPVQTLDVLENALSGYLSSVDTVESKDMVEFLKRMASFLCFLDMLECQIFSYSLV